MHRAITTTTIIFAFAFAFASAGAGCAFDAAIGEGGDPALEETLFAADNGIRLDNGLALGNGAALPNGVSLSNGLDLSNGVDLANGIKLPNGVKLPNGITGPYYAPPPGSALEQWIDVDPVMRRRILRYLIECALPSTAEVQLLYRGQLEVLGRGVGGLAPGLQVGSMSAEEEEKVSACLLARVNVRGEAVMIDMFGPMENGLFDTAADPASSPEGAFFGNLFLPAPAAFVCSAEGDRAMLTRSCDEDDCSVMTYVGACQRPLGSKYVSGCWLWADDGYFLGCGVGSTGFRYPLTTYLGHVESDIY